MTATESEILTPRPDHVPVDRVFDIDMYNLEGIHEKGYLEAWKAVQDQGVPDLVWTPRNGGHWIATSGAMIRGIYTDPEHFSSRVLFIPKAAGEKYAMVPSKMDPPEHQPYRQVVDKGLNLRSVRAMSEAIRAEAIELIDAFAADGECDFVEQFSGEFPIRVFMRMANLPISDAPMLRAQASAMTRPAGTTPNEMAEALDQANKALFDYVSPIIDQRLGGDGTDLISITINGTIDGQPMKRDKMLGMIALLLLAGLDSVTNFMNMVMDYLGRHPDKVAQLLEDPEEIRRAVEELFRRFPLVAAARMVAGDVERDGVLLKEGEMVLLPTPLHGLDERINPEPWKLDFDRKGISHSTFGDGPHRCAGLHLARLEVIVMLEEWLKRIPRFQVAQNSRPTYRAGVVAEVAGVRLTW